MDVVGQAHHGMHHVFDQQHSDAAVADLADDGNDLQNLGGVEPGHHLIEQQQPGRGGQRPRQLQPLAPGHGELGRRLRQHVRHADLLGNGLSMGPGLRPVAELLVGAHRDVFVYRELGKGLGNLESTHHTGAGNLVHRQPGDVAAQKSYPTRVERQKAGDTGKQRGLASAIGADQRHDAALIHPQAGVVDCAQAAEDFGEAGDFQHHVCPPAGLRRRLNRSIRPLGR